MENVEPKAGRRRRQRAKTWSRLGNLGRVPSEYEIVTHGMNHTARGDGGLPLEMGESRQGNQWILKHRDHVPLQAEDWNRFRDPHQVTYRLYNRMQDEAETFVDRVLEDYEGSKELGDAWLTGLGTLLTPQRYPVHGLQMLATYISQMGPSTYVSNCASFQAADELRRVQRIAYRTKQLQLAHPSREYGSAERRIWEQESQWQRIREAIERALVAYDWDECFVATNLVVKPVFDELFLRELAGAARHQGDEVDALLLENLYRDSSRSRDWSQALSIYAIEQRAENREVLRSYVDRWVDLAEAMVQSGAAMLAEHSADDANAILARCRAALEAVHEGAGLAR